MGKGGGGTRSIVSPLRKADINLCFKSCDHVPVLRLCSGDSNWLVFHLQTHGHQNDVNNGLCECSYWLATIASFQEVKDICILTSKDIYILQREIVILGIIGLAYIVSTAISCSTRYSLVIIVTSTQYFRVIPK